MFEEHQLYHIYQNGGHSLLEKVLKVYFQALKERFHSGLPELTSDFQFQDQKVPIMLITSREINSHEYETGHEKGSKGLPVATGPISRDKVESFMCVYLNFQQSERAAGMIP